MISLRRSAALLAPAILISLAACGGGGGGGGATPPTNPGGGSPPPSASSSPSPKPTATPTSAPTTTPAPSNTPTVDTALTLNATEDFGPNGSLWYTGGTASWANTAGDLSTSQAASGGTVDTMQCTDTIEGTQYPQTAYSQHVFVGIFYNGTEQALPQALGMVNPVAPTQGTPQHKSNTDEVEQYQCEYNVHTHDYSGLVHIEDVSQAQNSSYTFALPYATLQTLVDLWGAQLTANGLVAGSNALNGPVKIYTGVPTGKTQGGQYPGDDLVNSYSLYTGALGSVPLARHNAIWIVIGNYPAAGLPEVQFGEEN